MEHPMVKCSVANCQHWEDGNVCVADSIMIEITAHAHQKVGNHRDEASDSSETCCQTFEERPH
ncbi:DUF1540 domain-containing protein [Paenibacillus solisilvae]|uniref:DUF1540 domain-containing protein n=1 Tax=Paenibacillus solisilvae TaxID=2486751 RepID=A0ABW0W1U7_9BACL